MKVTAPLHSILPFGRLGAHNRTTRASTQGRPNAAFVEWLMGLPSAHAVGLSRTASIRLAGNAVVRLQARLIAINNERNL